MLRHGHLSEKQRFWRGSNFQFETILFDRSKFGLHCANKNSKLKNFPIYDQIKSIFRATIKLIEFKRNVEANLLTFYCKQIRFLFRSNLPGNFYPKTFFEILDFSTWTCCGFGFIFYLFSALAFNKTRAQPAFQHALMYRRRKVCEVLSFHSILIMETLSPDKIA